jgi:lipopolysaccharide/colanic/teichoic acid biosynthesis glycosyltransferase
MASPVILLLVAIVRLTSPGPGLFRQERTGWRGEEFWMYKIRTMYADAEKVSGPVWSTPGDSRVTPVGRVLRLLHLDELPQLINVARGEMDLVGPRPERPVFVARLGREISDYYARLQVRPGVTGLAQVNLPPDETVDCVRRKLAMDCMYIRDASLWLDLRILLCTFLRMLGIRHGRAVRWLRLERPIADAADASRHEIARMIPYAEHLSVAAEPDPYANGDGNGEPVAVGACENGEPVFSSSLRDAATASGRASRRPK